MDRIRDDSEQLATSTDQREIGALEALWSFFSSMKTAIVLLLILALASVVGTLIEDKMGVSVYGTIWFSLILSLVGVNLAVCSIKRFGVAWKRSVKPDVEVGVERITGMAVSESVARLGSLEDAADRVVEALRSRSYRQVRQRAGDTISIYAAKGRAGVWGPYLTHLSILVIFTGAIFGNMLGSEGYATIMEGERVADYDQKGAKEKTPLGFEVALSSFTIKHDDKGNPTGYRSDLQVYDGGKPTVRKVVDVNHPLSYKGLSFYQSSYGLDSLVMKITAPDGSVARITYDIGTENTPRGTTYVISDQPFRQFTLGGKNLTMFVHNLVPDYVGGAQLNGSLLPLNPAVDVMINDRFPAYKGLDAWKRLGWMTQSKPVAYKGLTVVLEKPVSYTVLQVSRNPALPVIYVGFALMVLGVFMSFYVTHKIIRVRIARSDDGVSVTMGASSRAEPAVFDKDFKRLRDALA